MISSKIDRTYLYDKDKRKICKREKSIFEGFENSEKIICNLVHFLYNLSRFTLLYHIIMDSTLIAAIQASTQPTKDMPEIKTGMEIEVHQIIKEGEKERIQLFRGLVIAMRGKTELDKVMTVRADIDGIGIEKIFPIFSPFISKIVVLRQFKVRRKNIRYIRDLTGKAARLKEIK